MSQWIKWCLLGLFAYVLLLIAKLPAAQVVQRLELGDNIAVFDLHGTIWQGSASMLLVNNIAIEQVNWDTSLLALFIGQLRVDIEAGNLRASDKVSISGPLAVSLFDFNHIQASDLSAYVPANMAIAQANLPLAVDATGRFKIEIDELDYQGKCVSLQGRGQWLNAGLEGLVGLNQPLSLDSFSADLGCIEDDLLVTINEPNLLNLSAQVRIPENLQVSVNGRFKPAAELPKQVQDATLFFRQTDDQGYHLIRL